VAKALPLPAHLTPIQQHVAILRSADWEARTTQLSTHHLLQPIHFGLASRARLRPSGGLLTIRFGVAAIAKGGVGQ